MRRLRIGTALAIGVVVATAGWYLSLPAVGRAAGSEDGPDAGVRKNAADYTAAFNAGDAKAAAACWAADGEYTNPDGETHRGRDAIAGELAAFLKAHPKATVEVTIGSVRPLGRNASRAEGTVRTKSPGGAEPAAARFSGVFVREDDGWKIATLRNWVPDPAADATVADVGWLAGEWAARGEGGDLTITYRWNAEKTFLTGTYTLTKDGKPAGSGTQVVGTDPAGGLRSWLFDGSGATGESAWTRDGDRWAVGATGTLPDGSEVSAVNLLVPLGPDAFTWQATARTAGGAELPDEAPVKVTRVK